MRQSVLRNLFNGVGVLLMRSAQEANPMVTFGPSYVITRYVLPAMIAGGALLLAHSPFHSA